ncbi:unnamed protein product [Linum tenue]|uniref:Uncharacterized protein n=1 Tax=Linum tenue TaxID=586396 RepID=A0AAV0Q732_9ROSI|nr:unnamed protein product [Linum tenue]CAI0626747.1 unnamed protein product [Linum tenue]
MGDMPTGLVS